MSFSRSYGRIGVGEGEARGLLRLIVWLLLLSSVSLLFEKRRPKDERESERAREREVLPNYGNTIMVWILCFYHSAPLISKNYNFATLLK